jgi:hypothetical protein
MVRRNRSGTHVPARPAIARRAVVIFHSANARTRRYDRLRRPRHSGQETDASYNRVTVIWAKIWVPLGSPGRPVYCGVLMNTWNVWLAS